MKPGLGGSSGNVPSTADAQSSSWNSGRDHTPALCSTAMHSIFPRTLRRQELALGWIGATELGTSPGSWHLTPCCLNSLSCIPVILDAHLSWAPLLPATSAQQQCGSKLGRTYCLLQLHCPVTGVMTCLGFQHHFQLCKMGNSWQEEIPENYKSLFCSSINQFIYPKGGKSLSLTGGNLFFQVLVGPVLLSNIHQCFPLDPHSIRRDIKAI